MKFRVFDPSSMRFLIEADELFISRNGARGARILSLMTIKPSFFLGGIHILDTRSYVFDESGKLLYNPREEEHLSKLKKAMWEWLLMHPEWNLSQMIWRQPYELMVLK